MAIGLKAPSYYVQGEGELDKLGKYVKKIGNTFLVLGSPNNKKRVGDRIEAALSSADKKMVYCEFGGECSKKVIADAIEIAQANNCDAIIGLGGGKALDTAKSVGINMGGLPTVIIPTIASNDAPCSSVAVIYNDEGVVIKALMMKRNPDYADIQQLETEREKVPYLFAEGIMSRRYAQALADAAETDEADR